MKDIDIYFDDKYAKLYEDVENGKARTFNFSCNYGKIKNQFIQREIPIKVDENKYYDIVTPYGYGGPVIIECNESKKDLLMIEYEKEFLNFCKNNYIVSEFIRFHPIIDNATDFESIYNVSFDRKTLGTNLRDYEDPIQSEFSKSRRKTIRKSLKEGVSFRVVEKPSDIGEFKSIYYSTMNRNGAYDYYYFGDNYFDKVLSLFQKNIILVKAIFEEKTIAQGFYFVYGSTIHAHLSGTLTEYLKLSPAYIIKYATALWGKENGYNLIHYGGGHSKSEDDSLYKFKKGFSKNTEFDFKIGKKIWNKQIYEFMCEQVGINRDTEFFPAYRS